MNQHGQAFGTGKRLKVLGLVLAIFSFAMVPLFLGSEPVTAQAKKRTSCTAGETDLVVNYEIVKGENLPASIPKPLSGKRGNADKGVEWMVNRRLGNCIACHQVTKIQDKVKDDDIDSLQKYGFHGDLAPTLDGVADRYTEAEIRMIVVDPKRAFPDFDTAMPAYHRNQGLERVIGDCNDMAILSAERVEDVVAFLATLKDE